MSSPYNVTRLIPGEGGKQKLSNSESFIGAICNLYII